MGDGNFHVLLLVDTNNDEERQKAEEILERLAVRTIEWAVLAQVSMGSDKASVNICKRTWCCHRCHAGD